MKHLCNFARLSVGKLVCVCVFDPSPPLPDWFNELAQLVSHDEPFLWRLYRSSLRLPIKVTQSNSLSESNLCRGHRSDVSVSQVSFSKRPPEPANGSAPFGPACARSRSNEARELAPGTPAGASESRYRWRRRHASVVRSD